MTASFKGSDSSDTYRQHSSDLRRHSTEPGRSSMSTTHSNNDGSHRKSRSAVRIEPAGTGDAPSGSTESGSTAQGSSASPLFAVLVDFIVRMFNARASGLGRQLQSMLVALFHSDGRKGEDGMHERLADAGQRVVAWGKQHPGQAIAVGAAVVTVAVLVGKLLLRPEEQPTPPRRTAQRRSQRKKTKST